MFDDFFYDERVYEIKVGPVDSFKDKHHTVSVSGVLKTEKEQYLVEKDYRDKVRKIIADNEYTHEFGKVQHKPNIGVINFGYWVGHTVKDEFIPTNFYLIWRVFMDFDELDKNWRKAQDSHRVINVETEKGTWSVIEKTNEFICSLNGKVYTLPAQWVNGLTWPLSRAAALGVILDALASEWYVAAKQPTKVAPIPVYGCDTEEGCRAWMENQIGDWLLVHNVDKAKVIFTDGVGDSIPMLPKELGTVIETGCLKDKYHYFAVIESRNIDDCLDWYCSQFNDVSEGIWKVERF